MPMGHFWVQNGPFVPNKKFCGKIFLSFSSTYWSLHWAKFWKILTMDPELRGCLIFAPKMSPFAHTDFSKENLLINLVPIIHAYLHSEKSNSDVNLDLFPLALKLLIFIVKKIKKWRYLKDHSFSTSAKFSEKLIFLTPWYAHVKNASFSKNVAYALNESCLMVCPFRSSG